MSDLRSKILEIRKSLPREIAHALGIESTSNFLQWARAANWTFDGLRVGLYKALGNEVSLDLLAERLTSSKAFIHFPTHLNPHTSEMDFVNVPDPTLCQWVKGQWGILEPAGEALVIAPDLLDLIFVPGVVFGREGSRIGRGKGFYDRYLVSAKNALRIALAYDFQVVESIAQNSWDQAVDVIVTEKRVIILKKAIKWRRK